jgi:REP element-mobilizing transposase RayT
MAKQIRLPYEAYSIAGSTWLVTIATLNRDLRVFDDPTLATSVLDSLERHCALSVATLHLAIVLPDHLHAIIEIANSNLVDVMRDFKTNSTRVWWEHDGVGALWQKSFHDRGLRTAEAFDHAVRYCLDNPVRLGLCGPDDHYPFVRGTSV